MTTFYTSDLHLYHRAMSYERRYGEWPKDRNLVTEDDVLWHIDTLAKNWDSVVTEDDEVWVLGDVIANPNHLTKALVWLDDRPGSKYCILGNHDPVHPMYQNADRCVSAYNACFDYVSVAATREIVLPDNSKQKVLLSHFPYEGNGEGREAKMDQWRLRDKGLPILHGHTHTKDKVTLSAHQEPLPSAWVDGEFKSFAPAKQIHVGLDAWDLTPVPEEQIGMLLA